MNRATVEYPNGTMRQVKNLGWLRRNWKSIERFEWKDIDTHMVDGLFTAIMRDGRVYRIEYASFRVFKRFINRPIFRGLLLTVNGIQGTI